VPGLAAHRSEPAHLPHHPLHDLGTAAQVGGQEAAALLGQVEQDGARFEHRHRRAAAGGSWSTIAGMRLLGLMVRNAGTNCSPRPMFTNRTAYGRSISSSAIEIFQPFGVGQ